MAHDDIVFRFCEASDLPELRALLTSFGLPSQDIRDGEQDYIIAVRARRIVGSVGIEKHGEAALLRSFAVIPELRGRGLGSKLYDRIVAHATLRNVQVAYVLTTTAERFCTARGFERIDRTSVPEALQATAVCMRRRLEGEARHFPADVLRVRPDVPGAAKWAVALDRAMLTYFEIAPHSRFDSHRHEGEQITLVLDGELFFEIDGNPVAVRAGQVVAIPSNVEHAAWTGEHGARAVDAWSPVRTHYLG